MKHLMKISFYIIVTLVSIELLLRLLGYAPINPSLNKNLQFLEYDSAIGWVHKPGNHQFIVNHWGDTMNFTINKQRERITKANPMPDSFDDVLLIGGSFIMGMGLNDEQTVGWKLQQKFASVDIRNLGVGAYGTYQSLLVLKDQLNQQKKPRAVIYGLISHHRFRNVAQSDWEFSLAMNERRSNIEVILPYVSLDANEMIIEKKKNIELPGIPFANHLAISFVIQRAFHKVRGIGRANEADKILELLLFDMQKMCKQADIPFYVNVLYSEKKYMEQLSTFFKDNDMSFIDCNIPLNESNIFKDDGHPQEVVTEEWAKRIGKRLIQDGIVSESDHQK